MCFPFLFEIVGGLGDRLVVTIGTACFARQWIYPSTQWSSLTAQVFDLARRAADAVVAVAANAAFAQVAVLATAVLWSKPRMTRLLSRSVL